MADGYEQGVFDCMFDLRAYMYDWRTFDHATGETTDIVDPDNAEAFAQLGLARGCLKENGDTLIDMVTMSKIQHLIGYAKSSLDVTPTVRTWFDRLCELAEELDAVLGEKDE